MACPGVLTNFSKEQIRQAILDHKGRLCPAAHSLGVWYRTIRRYIDADLELIELVATLRADFDETLLDKAESVLVHAMDRKEEDMTNALKATIFTLNNKGKERGYHPPVINQQGDIKITPSQLAQVSAEMKKHSEEKLADEK